MKKLKFLASLLFVGNIVSAQTAYVVPKEADINQEVTIYVNLKDPGCDCPNLVDKAGPIYIWSWNPSDPKVGNGDWGASNDALKMTDEGNNLWSFKMIPAEFYEITDVQKFYTEGISMLVKLKDGGSGGGTANENKSADLTVDIDPVPGCDDKLCPFPINFGQDDYFTVTYDNKKEEKVSMQNLQAGDVYLFARCVADGQLYEVSAFADVASNPDLLMTDEGEGKFTLTFNPEDFFPIPPGAEITSLVFVIRRKVFNGPDDKMDGTILLKVGCN